MDNPVVQIIFAIVFGGFFMMASGVLAYILIYGLKKW